MSLNNEPPTGHLRLLALRIMVLPLMSGALLLATTLVEAIPCWGVFILAGLLAWPIWLHRTEYRLFHRRLVVAGVMPPGSRLRPMLWKGTFIKAVQTLAALLLAWLLLSLVAPMSATHGYALALDALLLALIIQPVTRGLSGPVSAQHQSTVARHWPLILINTAILTGAIMWLDFAIVGTADTRQMAWHQVAVQAFNAVNDNADCILWGISGGVLAAIEALSWHLSLLVIPGLPDVAAQLAGWAFFLLRAATVAYLFTTLLLGIDIFIEKRVQRAGNRATGSTFSRTFLLTILLLAAPFYYASVKLGELDPASFANDVEATAQRFNPCIPNPAMRTQLQAQLDADIETTRVQANNEADSAITRGLERIFIDIRAGVDDYLDWYFSVVGEYQRLATAFAADTAAAMQQQLEQHLFASSDFDRQLVLLNSHIVLQSASYFADLPPALAATADAAPCETGPVSLALFKELDRDKFKASIAATSGIGAGIMTGKVLASKTMAAITGKLTAKASIKGGTTLASKILAKKGSSSLLSAGAGTVLCAPTGPIAILCGITAGAITWLSVDKILVETDEAFNREEMRADILQVLADQQAILTEQLTQQHYARIDAMAARLDASVQRRFVPYTDGVEANP
ncbi:MAG TPA: hypothetical protein DCO71_10800 [Gammaproteobacteria bacterium]|nr:hypothetical protein [Gammaproteobacteria bacterium]